MSDQAFRLSDALLDLLPAGCVLHICHFPLSFVPYVTNPNHKIMQAPEKPLIMYSILNFPRFCIIIFKLFSKNLNIKEKVNFLANI